MKEVAKLVLGTVQLGTEYGINNSHGRPSESESFSILNKATEMGINFFDTAQAYGNSLDIIIKYLRKFGLHTKILSKFHFARLEESLKDYVEKLSGQLPHQNLYSLSLHDQTEIDLAIQRQSVINKLKDAGHFNKFGISLYDLNLAGKIIDSKIFDIVQVPFNIFDASSEKIETLKRFKENGIEVHVRSVFLQGVFFKKFRHQKERATELRQYVEQLQEQFNHEEIETLCLKLPLEQEYIDKVLMGVETEEQLNLNLKALKRQGQFDYTSIINKFQEIPTEYVNPGNWK